MGGGSPGLIAPVLRPAGVSEMTAASDTYSYSIRYRIEHVVAPLPPRPRHGASRRPGRSPPGSSSSWPAGALAVGLGGQLEDELTIPGTESQEGIDILDTASPRSPAPRARSSSSRRGRADHGVPTTEIQAAVEALRRGRPRRARQRPVRPGVRELAVSDDGRHALLPGPARHPARPAGGRHGRGPGGGRRRAPGRLGARRAPRRPIYTTRPSSDRCRSPGLGVVRRPARPRPHPRLAARRRHPAADRDPRRRHHHVRRSS